MYEKTGGYTTMGGLRIHKLQYSEHTKVWSLQINQTEFNNVSQILVMKPEPVNLTRGS